MLQNNRRAIFIDIEGFSHFKTDNEFYRSVETILSTIYLIGSKVYNKSPERLFVHHIGGDGFLIVSDFAEKDLSRPIAITTILLRSLVLNGFGDFVLFPLLTGLFGLPMILISII